MGDCWDGCGLLGQRQCSVPRGGFTRPLGAVCCTCIYPLGGTRCIWFMMFVVQRFYHAYSWLAVIPGVGWTEGEAGLGNTRLRMATPPFPVVAFPQLGEDSQTSWSGNDEMCKRSWAFSLGIWGGGGGLTGAPHTGGLGNGLAGQGPLFHWLQGCHKENFVNDALRKKGCMHVHHMLL